MPPTHSKLEITVIRNLNGSITLSTIVNNQYIHHTYYGFSIQEAKQDFRAEMAKEEAR